MLNVVKQFLERKFSPAKPAWHIDFKSTDSQYRVTWVQLDRWLLRGAAFSFLILLSCVGMREAKLVFLKRNIRAQQALVLEHEQSNRQLLQKNEKWLQAVETYQTYKQAFHASVSLPSVLMELGEIQPSLVRFSVITFDMPSLIQEKKQPKVEEVKALLTLRGTFEGAAESALTEIESLKTAILALPSLQSFSKKTARLVQFVKPQEMSKEPASFLLEYTLIR